MNGLDGRGAIVVHNDRACIAKYVIRTVTQIDGVRTCSRNNDILAASKSKRIRRTDVCVRTDSRYEVTAGVERDRTFVTQDCVRARCSVDRIGTSAANDNIVTITDCDVVVVTNTRIGGRDGFECVVVCKDQNSIVTGKPRVSRPASDHIPVGTANGSDKIT